MAALAGEGVDVVQHVLVPLGAVNDVALVHVFFDLDAWVLRVSLNRAWTVFWGVAPVAGRGDVCTGGHPATTSLVVSTIPEKYHSGHR